MPPGTLQRSQYSCHTAAKGIDFVVVRELIGGVYFGEHRTEEVEGEKKATDIMAYSEHEVRRIARVAKDLKGDKSLQKELDFLKRLQGVLEGGQPARSVECDEDEVGMMGSMALLTSKPIIYAANLSEDDFSGGEPANNPYYKQVEELAAAQGAEVLPICAQMEADSVDMDAEEKLLFLSELGLESKLGPESEPEPESRLLSELPAELQLAETLVWPPESSAS